MSPPPSPSLPLFAPIPPSPPSPAMNSRRRIHPPKEGYGSTKVAHNDLLKCSPLNTPYIRYALHQSIVAVAHPPRPMMGARFD
jgi:hypothetical protein